MAGMVADDGEFTLFGFIEGGDGGADLAWGAVAALEAIVLEEGGLNGMEIFDAFATGEAFDGGDVGTLGGEGEGEAGVDAAAVEQDGAGPALAVVAALLRAGEVEVLAEDVEEGGAGVKDEGVRRTVDFQGDRVGLFGGLGEGGQADRGGGGEGSGGVEEGAARESGVCLWGRGFKSLFEFRVGAQGSGHRYLRWA